MSDIFRSEFVEGDVFNLPHYADADALDDLLLWGKAKKCSDMTLTSESPAWAQIGSKLHRVTNRALTAMEMENYARVIYGADTAPSLLRAGRDMDPTHEIRDNTSGLNELVRFRVNITGCRIPGGVGISFTFRTLPSQPPPIEALGMEQEVMDVLRAPMGLNLVTGPTGSGKSTLLYSMLRALMERETASEKLLDYSRPIEFVFDGLDFPHSFAVQTEVGTHLKDFDDTREAAQWSYATRNSLRRAPEIILIGESRDNATFGGCLENCLTGHLTFTTMHTVGVPGTIRRALQFFNPGERRGVATDMLSTLNIVLTQRLLPRCDGPGRVAIREYLHFNDYVRRQLVELDHEMWPKKISEIMAQPPETRGTISKTLYESALPFYEQGIISELTFKNETRI